MATEVVKIVDTGGTGDYSSLPAWEAGEQRDLVTADEIAVADCRCTTGAADTNFTINGWTTDATRYIKIWTDPNQGYRHEGKWDDTKYRVYSSSGFTTYAINIAEPYVIIEGLQIGGVNADYRYPIYAGKYESCNFTVAYGLVRDCNAPSSPQNAHGIYIGNYGSSNRAYIYNTIVYDCYGAGIYAEAGAVYSYNNTVYNCDLSNNIYRHGVTGNPIIAINTLSYNNGHADFGTLDSSSDYNLSSDGTAPGAHSVTNATVTFVDEANDDFHLDASDTVAKDAGTDLSSDPNLAFTDDIDGETRSAPWDIGADEYVSGGGGETITINVGSIALTPQALYLPEQYIVGDGLLIATGKNLYSNLAMLIENATATLGGKDIKINERIHIGETSAVLTGLNVIIGGAVGIGKATLITAGKTLKMNEAIAITKGALSLVGKSVQTLQSSVITVLKATATLVGRAFKVNEAIKIAVANCVAQGKNLYVNGETIARKLAKIVGSMFKKIVGG